ncbi:MAG: ribosomal RNA small subunit methyltransferase A [Clostridia bacterium]|nr:ribosomal RNA small subunit methyltransferase A [Clostridia bacterium]
MDIKSVLIANNFHYNKALGQNFITDVNLLDAIVKDAGVTSEDVVVEIGTGAGSLTRALGRVAKRVASFEVDDNLRPVLATTLADLPNVEVVFADVLKMSDEDIKSKVLGPFKVVANLPYYITTQLLMRFVESDLDVTDLTCMIQKEVADRLTAKAGTADYGAVTVAVDAVGYGSILRVVNKNMFFPVPKVDSALYHLRIDREKFDIKDMRLFKKTVRAAFLWRRKTLANNLQSAFSITKSQAEEILIGLGYDPMIRGERLSAEEFVRLSERLKDNA